MSSFVNASANSIGTTTQTIYSANTKAIVIGCNISNILGTIIPVDIIVNVGGKDVYIKKELRIDNGSSEEIMRGNKIVLVPGDSFKARSYANSSIDIVLSILEGVS